MERKASDLFVECLEVEGVKYVFGIPGEETLDLNESLANSSVDFIPVRHEQGGPTWRTCTGASPQRAGVCLGTLGPGATNLITAVADAFLDRSPLVALTGQGDLERMHKESHQYIDIVSIMKPVTKWNARLNSSQIIPEVVRKAFKVAQAQKPGPTHIELPEDVMAARSTPRRCPRARRSAAPSRRRPSCSRPPSIIRSAINPVVLAGNGVARVGAAPRCASSPAPPASAWRRRSWARACSTTRTRTALGTVGLQSRDYALAGFEDADVVITVGYDLVEHSPENWNPKKDKKIVCIDTTAAEVDENFQTEVDLVGDLYHILTRLAEELRDARTRPSASRLNDIILGRFHVGQGRRLVPDAAAARCGRSATRWAARTC